MPTKNSHQKTLSAVTALAVAGVLAAACSSGGSSSGSGRQRRRRHQGGAAAQHRPDHARPTTPGCKQLTKQYEAAHKNVTVQWLPNNSSAITQANATVESQASGGGRPRPGLGAVRPGDLRRMPERAAAEHQALPGQAQPVRARQLQLAVAVLAEHRPLHDLAQRRHRHHPRLQRRDRHVLQQGRVRQGRDHRHARPPGRSS